MPRGVVKRKSTDSQLVKQKPKLRKLSTVIPRRSPRIIPPPEFKADNQPIIYVITHYIPIDQWPSLERVSKQFRDCVREAWKTVEKMHIFKDWLLSSKLYADYSVEKSVFKSALNYFSLRTVDVRDFGPFPVLFGSGIDLVSESLPTILSRFKELRRFDMNDCDTFLQLGDLASFLESSASRDKLIELSITMAKSDSQSDHQRFADAFGNLTNLETIQLERSRLDTICASDKSLTCSFLRNVVVSNLTTFRIARTYVPRRQMIAFLERASQLKRLSFSFVCWDDETQDKFHTGPSEISSARHENSSLLEAVGELTNLDSLRIHSNYEAIEDCPCRSIGAEMKVLYQMLDHRRCKDGSRIFKELRLDEFMCVAQFVAPIAECLPNLESLSLHAHFLDDETLRTVLRSQTTLRSLRVHNLGLLDKEVHIDNGSFDVGDILANAATLEHLSLNYALGGHVFGDLSRFAEFHELRTFEYMSPDNRRPVNNADLLEWAFGFGRNLESFVLRREFIEQPTKSIDEEYLADFLSMAPKLKRLRVRGVPLTDTFMRDLPRLWGTLKEVLLAPPLYQDATTKMGVQRVLDRCPQLEIFGINKYMYTAPWYPNKLKLEKHRRVEFAIW